MECSWWYQRTKVSVHERAHSTESKALLGYPVQYVAVRQSDSES